MSEVWWESLALVAGLLTLLWLISLVLRDASIIDPFWGMGFVCVAWFAAWRTDMLSNPRGQLLCGLTSVWGLRLSLYLFLRNRLHGEDRRYAAMRTKHGAQFWWVSLLTVFWLQAIILWIVAAPIIATCLRASTQSLGLLDAAGIVLWVIGVFFEAVGDYQMSRFQSQPENAGRVMNRGLWRFTRHPNYFGDFCVWWGLFLITAAGGSSWTVFSPLLMSILLMKVSGVSLLEKTITSRRPDYTEYQRVTNAFFPWPPRASSR